MADWRQIMRGVLSGVTTPPAIPQNFQQPQAGIPLPALGRFGTQAFNLAGLPASIPTRNVAPAAFVPSGGAPQGPVTGGGDGAALPNPLQDAINGLGQQGIPIVPGRDSRIPDPYADGVMGDSAQQPVTYPTPQYPFFDSPDAVPVPPPHLGPDFVGPTQPENPIAPWAPYVPGQTTTEHSDILNPGTTVGDFLSPPPSSGGTTPSATDFLTNPIGSAVGAIGNLFDSPYAWGDNPEYAGLANPWDGNPIGSSLNFTDVPSFDPFNFWQLDPQQQEQLRQLGYWKDA